MRDGKIQIFPEVAFVLPHQHSYRGEGFSIQQFSLSSCEVNARTLPCYSVVLHISPPVIVEWVQGTRTQKREFRFGDVSFHSPGNVSGFRLQGEAALLEIALSPSFVRQTLQDAFPSGRLCELPASYGVPDTRTQFIGLTLMAELTAGSPSGPLFAQSLATALTAHLFAGRILPLSEQSGGLSRSDVRRVTDFIHASLDQELSLTTLAALTSYSPHHFTLLFKKALGVSPHQFVIRARAEEACRLLASSKMPLGEIAYRIGFANQSHFQQHFKRLFGVTPTQYRHALQERSFSA